MAFSSDEAHGHANHTSTKPVTTEQLDSPSSPKSFSNILAWAYKWLWAKGRITLLLFILTIFALILTHTTTPLTVHPQYLHAPPAHSASQNSRRALP
jgi:hypothetical protein